MHNYISCICVTFLHCVCSNYSSSSLPDMMQSHICCICLSFIHCAFKKVFQIACERSFGCIYLSFIHCAFLMFFKLLAIFFNWTDFLGQLSCLKFFTVDPYFDKVLKDMKGGQLVQKKYQPQNIVDNGPLHQKSRDLNLLGPENNFFQKNPWSQILWH